MDPNFPGLRRRQRPVGRGGAGLAGCSPIGISQIERNPMVRIVSNRVGELGSAIIPMFAHLSPLRFGRAQSHTGDAARTVTSNLRGLEYVICLWVVPFRPPGHGCNRSASFIWRCKRSNYDRSRCFCVARCLGSGAFGGRLQLHRIHLPCRAGRCAACITEAGILVGGTVRQQVQQELRLEGQTCSRVRRRIRSADEQ